MKLLLITQIVDPDDPILGFMHRWIEVLSSQFESIEVICLKEGSHSLPTNVSVHTLGKERGRAHPLRYLFRFYRHLVRLEGRYSHVFIHMNAEYLTLGGWWWRLRGRFVALWYNHKVASMWLTVSARLANRILYTSPQATTARYAHALRMPAGIDTELFVPGTVAKEPGSLYYQGRISSVKNIDVLLEAFATLHERGVVRVLRLVGPEDHSYTDPIKQRYRKLIDSGAVVFVGPLSQRETPPLYARSMVTINLTQDGSYDKTVLESLACGTPVIASNRSFAGIPGVMLLSERTSEALVECVEKGVLGDPAARPYVEANESLRALSDSLASVFGYTERA